MSRGFGGRRKMVGGLCLSREWEMVIENRLLVNLIL